MNRQDLSQIGAVRADAGHRLFRVDDSGKPTDLILPDNFSPKAPVDAARAQGSLQIESRKAKTSSPVPLGEFFVYIPGAEPDRLALDLVNRASFFDNLDQQLAAMQGFVSSFPDSPGSRTFAPNWPAASPPDWMRSTIAAPTMDCWRRAASPTSRAASSPPTAPWQGCRTACWRASILSTQPV